MEKDNPGPNPSTGNPENILYEEWKMASDEVKPEVENRLLSPLRTHISTVCWIILRTNEPDLIEEAVQDTILQLSKFEERSLFSTWVHSRALNKFRAIARTRRRLKEISLYNVDLPNAVSETSSMDRGLLVKEMLQFLEPKDRKVLQMKLEGATDREVALELGFRADSNYANKLWKGVIRKLQKKYDIC